MKVISIIGIIISVISMIGSPILFNNIKISDNSIEVFDTQYSYEISDNEITISEGNSFIGKISVDSTTDLEEYLSEGLSTYHLVSAEVIVICLTIALVLIYLLLDKLEKLFINIHNCDTPFTLENVQYVKQIALFLALSILFSFVSGIIFEIVTKIDMGVELEAMDIIYVLIVFSLSYIFEYGYEIQLDSAERIYDENE